MLRKSLTARAHEWLQARIKEGHVVIDATAGNGYDTLFLARLTGITGKVYAFDIQSQAIAITQSRLQEAGMKEVELFQCSHSEMKNTLPVSVHGGIRAVMFNLGYLPKGDKAVITHAETTISALQQALNMLAKPAYMTIIAYPGHAGGREEQVAIERWLEDLDQQRFSIEHVISDKPLEKSPKLYFIEHRG